MSRIDSRRNDHEPLDDDGDYITKGDIIFGVLLMIGVILYGLIIVMY